MTEEEVAHEISKPPMLEVGKITHFSVELNWGDAMKETSEKGRGKGMVKVHLQRKNDTPGQSSGWIKTYTGMGKKTLVDGLEPLSDYIFRYQFEQKGIFSPWSSETRITTKREPLYACDLHMAIKKESLETLEEVLKSGEVIPDVKNEEGFTALMAAVKKPFIEAIGMLIEYGADVNFQNDNGKTALMLACASNLLDSVKELRKYNADYIIFDNGGCTALHWAVDSRSVKLIEWMATDHADFNINDRGNGGWTPLIRCANLHGDRDVALTLMVTGNADINGTDNNGNTALHHAVMRKHYDLTLLLLQRLANPLQPNKENNTPEMIARSSEDRKRIAQLMEPYVENWKQKEKRKHTKMALAKAKLEQTAKEGTPAKLEKPSVVT